MVLWVGRVGLLEESGCKLGVFVLCDVMGWRLLMW